MSTSINLDELLHLASKIILQKIDDETLQKIRIPISIQNFLLEIALHPKKYSFSQIDSKTLQNICRDLEISHNNLESILFHTGVLGKLLSLVKEIHHEVKFEKNCLLYSENNLLLNQILNNFCEKNCVDYEDGKISFPLIN